MKNIIPEKRARSKWLILVVDQVIVCWSLALSLFVVMQFNFSAVQRGYFFIYSITYLVVTCLVFMLLKIHTGIVRYANLDDVYRIFMATMISSISYWVLIQLVITPYLHHIWRGFDLAVVLNFFISSTLLILLRIYVKQGYLYLRRSEMKASEPILIYSKTRSAIIVKHALEQQGEHCFNVLGYINNDPDKVGKYLQQKKIYHSSDIPFLRNKYQLSKVIICGEDLDFKEKKMIMESCINEGIMLSHLPPPAQWVSGRLSLGQIKNLDINDLLRRDPIVLCKANISKELRNKRVLITGAAGSIGSEIVRQIVDYDPSQLILCDQAESPLHDLQLELADIFDESKTVIFLANVQDRSRTQQLFEKYRPEFVFHAAAYKHVPLMESNPTEAIMTNVLGTKNIADLSMHYGVERFIMISTDKAVNPTNVMGATKRLAEIYIQSLQFSRRQIRSNCSDTCFITTRFGNVLGSNGSVVPRFRSQIDAGGPITITHPDITRYFMTIPEAVELVLEAGSTGKGGEIFVFDMGDPIKIVDLANSMIKLAGLVPKIDIDIVYTGLRPGEKLYEELLSNEELTIPTHNQKIKIARVRLHDLKDVEDTIASLLDAKYSGDEIRMIQIIKNFIPEYKSNNSLFETLDDSVTI